MTMLKLEASVKDYVWGGRRLIDEYGKKAPGDSIAETWELSCYPGSESVIKNGEYAGKTLSEYISGTGGKVLGKNCEDPEHFPVLVKFIDAKEDLSIQVHPDDEYAREHGHYFGKSEMWYIIDAAEGAVLCHGLNKKLTKKEFKQRINDGTLMEVLNRVPVKRGDVFFIGAGTIHSIGKGILLAEVQQNSNITYRVFDYKRKDSSGKERELHIKEALDVAKLEPEGERYQGVFSSFDCAYFTVDRKDTLESTEDEIYVKVGNDSFRHLLFTRGSGRIKNGEEELEFSRGDSIFLPASSGDHLITGRFEVIITHVG